MKNKITNKSQLTKWILSLLFPSTLANIHKTRSLLKLDYIKFLPDSIYYKLKYIQNDMTGTGNKLQDIPYKTLCIIKDCPNICCIGEITSMKCGTKEQCKEFYDTSIYPNVVAAVIFPILILSIFIISYLILNKIYKKNKCLSALLAFCCMFVFTIPFVILILICFKPYEEPDKKE